MTLIGMHIQFLRKFRLQWIPTRVVICIMMFSCCWMNYMCRLQMSILAVPMIKTFEDNQGVTGACATANNNLKRRSITLNSNETIRDELFGDGNNTEEVSLDILKSGNNERQLRIQLFNSPPFQWTPFIRGQLISAYAWGNVPGNFIGGILAQRFGPRQSVLWSSILAALVSLITPILAQVHWAALAVSRVVIGMTAGVTFPACHTLVAKWSPPDEKGRFVWTLQGGTFGSIFLFAIISGIAENINWECGWYLPAIVMMIWIGFWWWLAYDSPEEHPTILETEKKFIIESRAGIVRKERPTLTSMPMFKIFTSIPFICLVLLHFGNTFLLFFYQSGMMLYQTKALGFQLTKGGFMAGLPWASRVIFAFFFGWAGDAIKRKNIITVTTLRKSATIFSHLLPGICLIAVGYVGCSLVWANVFLVLALGFNGAASIANLSNNQDLSPNYAGFLYGIMNTVGALAGILIPPVVEEIAGKWGHPIEKWRILFWIGAMVCIVCMVLFMIGGSGKVQYWNELKSTEESSATGTSSSATNRDGGGKYVAGKLAAESSIQTAKV